MEKTHLRRKRTLSPERGAGRIARNRMRIAWMYYVEGLTQNEIADRLGIGRVTVVRNINEAIRQREVKIWIEGEVSECFELEAELKDAFGFREAVVVPEPVKPENVTKSIGVAAGMYVSDALQDDMSVGVGWGATLYESLATLAPRELENVQVISLLGGIVQARKFNPAEFAWQFARIMGADCYLFQAPAVVDSPATREALIERCGLRDIFRRAERLDLALLSVGTMAPSSTAFRFNLISDEERAELLRKGAVGDLLFNFYDRNGNPVDHPVNRRIMSLPIEQLRNVPARVIASGGNDKVECLLGAIKLVNCNVLITNEATARELILRRS
ncbi:sugar-binding transcriptional regulator [Aestuariivirga sp.]|uniref:sugar-binding transcriptional regulator n=1 Tax=Aestuariivirga sp. TaxID=2650926 RepID=UPI003BA8BDDB